MSPFALYSRAAVAGFPGAFAALVSIGRYRILGDSHLVDSSVADVAVGGDIPSPAPLPDNGAAPSASFGHASRLRVLYVCHTLPPERRPLSSIGGMQRVAAELLAVLEAHPEIAVTPVVLRSSWRATYFRTVPFLGRALWTIRRGAERRDFDVVLFSSMVTASLLMPVVRKLLSDQGIPAVAIVHGQDVTWQFGIYQDLVRGAIESLDVVVPVSRATAKVCLERGTGGRKFQVIPNGVNLNGFARPANLPGLFGTQKTAGSPFPEYGLPPDAFLLCSVGRQVARKGYAWFVDQVIPLLPADIHYWLAGKGPEGENIRTAVERRGLAGR